jgi:uncharacterized membrane protein
MPLFRLRRDYMSRPSNQSTHSSGKAFASSAKTLHAIVFLLFLTVFAFGWLAALNVLVLAGNSGWLLALVLFAAALTTLVSQSRQLPTQNVLLAATIIAAMTGVGQALGALTGIPFGPYFYTDAAGPKIFNVLPWSVPVIWIIVLLNARGVARLILRPWRKSRLYGFRLIGVTAALAVVFDLGLEPFASQVNHFWVWQPTKLALLWHGTPPSNFLGWLMTALLVLAFATTVMINKSHQKYPSDYHPLIMWLVLNLLFATATATHQLWVATGFIALAGLITTVMAVRGARW